MTNGTIGADLAALRELSASFGQAQQQLSGISLMISSRVNAPGYWNGSDADRFRAAWNADHRMRILAAESFLTEGATTLRANVDEQEGASDQGSGSIPAGNGGGTGNGGGAGNGGSDPEQSLLERLLGGLGDLGSDAYDLYGDLDSLRGATELPIAALSLARTLQLSGEFATLDDALRAASQGRTFARLAEVLGGGSWGPELQALSNAIPEGGISRTIGSLAEPLGSVGKALGPIGVALGALTTYQDIQNGDYGRAGLHGATTVLGAVALMPIPPVNLACGVAAGALALGELAYDHIPIVHDAFDAVGSTVADGAEALGDGIENLGEGIADVAEDVWPF